MRARVRCLFIVFHCAWFAFVVCCFTFVVAFIVAAFVCVHCSQPMDDGVKAIVARVTAPGVVELTSTYKLKVC